VKIPEGATADTLRIDEVFVVLKKEVMEDVLELVGAALDFGSRRGVCLYGRGGNGFHAMVGLNISLAKGGTLGRTTHSRVG